MDDQQKTLWIGVLASYDSPEKNNALARLLEHLAANKNKNEYKFLDNLGFLFTGGTFDRVILGTDHKVSPVNDSTIDFLKPRSIRLPSHDKGGVIILSYLIAQVKCRIVWPFLTLKTGHLLNPANLALLRLCDFWRARVLMNRGSVEEWIQYKAKHEIEELGLQPSFMFSVRAKNKKQLAQSLDAGKIPQGLGGAFTANNITLSAQASVEVITAGAKWRLTDQGRMFIICLENGTLNIYLELEFVLRKRSDKKWEYRIRIENFEDKEIERYKELFEKDKREKLLQRLEKFKRLEEPKLFPLEKETEGTWWPRKWGEEARENSEWYKEDPKNRSEWTIALIAHDKLKERMLNFAREYKKQLAEFGCILATGTTGGLVKESVPELKDKIYLYDSGPKGGDIEIATEVLYGRCHAVIFFIDPLRPHPHMEDIRTLLGACMLQDRTLIFTNEDQARDWMDRVIKGGKW